MNIFNSLKNYAGKWSVVSERSFSQEEINSVKEAYVTDSQYGNSVCFVMVSGGQTYIPLSSNSSVGLGDSVDLSKAKLLELARPGETNITRVEV